MAYFSSLEVVLAISHSYVILPKLFPHYLSLILIFRFDKDSGIGVSVSVIIYHEICLSFFFGLLTENLQVF